MKAAGIRKFGGAQILPWITFLAIAAVWCVLSYGGLVGPLFVPSPSAVFDKITLKEPCDDACAVAFYLSFL